MAVRTAPSRIPPLISAISPPNVAVTPAAMPTNLPGLEDKTPVCGFQNGLAIEIPCPPIPATSREGLGQSVGSADCRNDKSAQHRAAVKRGDAHCGDGQPPNHHENAEDCQRPQRLGEGIRTPRGHRDEEARSDAGDDSRIDLAATGSQVLDERHSRGDDDSKQSALPQREVEIAHVQWYRFRAALLEDQGKRAS
jgi:hypothetical protein